MAERPWFSANFGRHRWWLAGVGGFFVAALLVMSAVFRPSIPEAGEPIRTQPVVQTPAEVLAAEAAYRNAVYSIFSPWKDSQGENADYAGLQAALLALTVPGRYRAVHLDLAVALGMLGDGRTAQDRTLRDEGMGKIQEIFSDNPWIIASREGGNL